MSSEIPIVTDYQSNELIVTNMICLFHMYIKQGHVKKLENVCHMTIYYSFTRTRHMVVAINGKHHLCS